MEPYGIEDVAQQLVYLRGVDIAEDGANVELDELCRLDLEARSLGECHRGGGVDRRPAGDARIEHSVLGKERRDSVPVRRVAPHLPVGTPVELESRGKVIVGVDSLLKLEGGSSVPSPTAATKCLPDFWEGTPFLWVGATAAAVPSLVFPWAVTSRPSLASVAPIEPLDGLGAPNAKTLATAWGRL